MIVWNATHDTAAAMRDYIKKKREKEKVKKEKEKREHDIRFMNRVQELTARQKTKKS
jgi:hypothetical protein